MGMTLRKNPPTYFVVHCSDSKFGTEKLIHKWHSARGFANTGYNHIIMNQYPNGIKEKAQPWFDGQIIPGRALKYVGAHCRGKNSVSVGVCLIGTNIFTKAQFDSLRKLYKYVCAYYGKKLIIKGHRDFDKNKSCPNFNAQEIINAMAESEKSKNFRYIKSVDVKLNLLNHRLRTVERKIIHVP